MAGKKYTKRGAKGSIKKISKKKSYRHQRSNKDEKGEKKEKVLLDLDVEKDATEYFTKNATFDQHYDAQIKNRDKYVATLLAFNDYSIDIIPNARAHSLSAAFARRDTELIKYLLEDNKNYGFTDVLKAITILDSSREKKAIEKKLDRIAKTGSVIKPKKMGKFKNTLNNLELIKPKAGSLSGALVRHIKRWVRKFPEKDLEFFALSLPTEPWRKLADLCHFNPVKDFPNANWFLPFCFGKEPEKDSKLDKCRKMTAENVNQLIQEFDLPYRVVSKFKANLNDASKKKLAESQEKLDTILWYYEDLACRDVDDIIKARLERGDALELGYGKLMERLLLFKDLRDRSATNVIDTSLFSLLIPIAENNLKNFKSTIASPVAVLGDASGSMEVAIRTSTIISSLLATICSAKLTFFNDKNFECKLDPKDIKDVLEVAYSTKANSSTAPAASLVPYFEQKKVIKTFIIVTDEEENCVATTQDKKTWRFFELFMEYRKNVYPSSLIFVSFLASQHSQGQMYSQFVREKVPDVFQFKFSRSRPDLTKLDSILGKLCSKSSETFSGHVEKLESEIKTKGLIKAFENLNTKGNNQKPIEF